MQEMSFETESTAHRLDLPLMLKLISQKSALCIDTARKNSLKILCLLYNYQQKNWENTMSSYTNFMMGVICHIIKKAPCFFLKE